MRHYIKNSLSISFSEISIVLVALVKNKFLAVSIGTRGFGIFGLLNTFFSFIAVFAGAWMQTGATRLISEYREHDGEKLKISSYVIGIVLMISVVMTLILIANYGIVKHLFLSDEIQFLFYLLFAICLVGITLKPVIFSLLQGLMDIRAVVKYRIVLSLVELTLTILLVLLFNLVGFFLSLAVSSIITTYVLWKYLYNSLGKRFKFPSLWGTTQKRLMEFGAVNLVLGIADLGSQFLQRSIILKSLDISSVGLFQGAVAMMTYLGFINRGVTFQFFPQMSEQISMEERIDKIRKVLRIILIVNFPIVLLALLFSDIVIPLLFSHSFINIAAIFYLFVIAHYFNMLAEPFQLVVVAMDRLRVHSYFTILIHSLWVLFPLLFISRWGLLSLGLSYLIGSIFKCFAYSTYTKSILKHNFILDLFPTALYIGIVVAVNLWFINAAIPTKMVSAILSCVVFVMLLTREEKHSLVALLSKGAIGIGK